MRTTARKIGIFGALLALAGCGGDGGGAGSVASTPPPPVNTSLAKLVASQSLADNAATQTATISASTANVTAGASTSQPLTIAFDSASNSYAITTQGRSQTFAPSNQASAAKGIAIYAITNGSTADRLTIESASVTGYGSTYPQYSGLGYWQRTVTGTASSAVSVDFFIYGLDSAASVVPRTGQAAYATSTYGLVTLPGSEARFYQGSGRMDIDFLNGLFTTSASAYETGIISQNNYGNGVVINGSGTLSSSANGLSGVVTYSGLNSKSTGTLSGQFYGPAAQELGASFVTSGADGSSTSGVIWGNQNSTLTPTNLTMTNIVSDQSFVSKEAQIPAASNGGGNTPFLDTGEVDVTAAGGVTVSPQGLPSATFTSADKVTGTNASFIAYAKGSVAVDLYKAGTTNTELALTYLTFGSWQGPVSSTGGATATSWFAYGLGTQPAVIQARTGSASYAGVAYGTAINGGTGTSATVTGTATFAVNFDMGGYSGSFGLKSATTDYGTFNASGTISAGTPQVGGLTGVTAGSGNFLPAFYGPTGQEFGGPFHIAIPTANTTIAGVAAAKGG